MRRGDQKRALGTLADIVTDRGADDIDSLDLGALLELASHHRVELLTIDRLGVERTPDRHLDQRRTTLRSRALASRMHAIRTLAVLRECVDRPFLVVKGPAAATQWYDDPVHREFGDIDVLVRRSDFVHVFSALQQRGFASLLHNWHGFRSCQVAQVPLQFESSSIDLHWRLVATGTDRTSIDFDESGLFARSIDLTLASQSLRTLGQVDTLVHACVNAGLAGARRLKDLLDIHLIVGRILGETHTQDAFVRHSREAGAQALCAAVLLRARDVLGTEVPDGLLERLEPWPGWTRANGLVNRGSPTRSGSVASGLLLSSGRDSRRATVAKAAELICNTILTSLGRPSATDPGGVLDWRRRPSYGTELHHQQRYLAWVDAAGDQRRRRCREVDEFTRILEPFEPRATPLAGTALLGGLGGRRCRADVIESGDGTVLGALVTYRWTIGHATGYPLVLDPGATGALAELVDRIGVTDLAGFDRDVDLLRPLLPRWRGSTPATAVTLTGGFDWEVPTGSARVATRRDLDQLTTLMWLHSPHGFANKWLMRARLRRAIEHLVIVVEDGDSSRLVAAAVRDSATKSYHCWAHVVVDPAHRGEGLSWSLVAAAARIANDDRVGVLSFAVASNPMPIPSDTQMPETWHYVGLSRPHRFRGEPRLRRVVDLMLGLPARFGPSPDRGEVFRKPGATDGRVSDVRTQRWWQLRRTLKLSDEGARADQEW